MTDIEVGKEALKYFHNRSTRYSAYNLSFDGLLSTYGKKADIYAEGIGLVISSNQYSMDLIRKSMEDLADVAKGRVPKDHQEYIKYIQNRGSQINWLDLTATVAKDVAVQAAEGLQSVGDNVLSTLKILNFVWPIALLYFLWVWFGSKVKGAKK